MRVRDREGGGGHLIKGDGCKIADSVDIDTTDYVVLGEGVGIGDEVLILTHDHDPADISRKHWSRLVIGHGAWIGARAIILASCDSIGKGAVVGAGSVVTHDVPDDELWAGNPARFIRRLR